MKLLVNEKLCKTYAEYADSLIKIFVRQCTPIYGKAFVSYNIHNLTHLASDCLEYGSLDKFSAFRFENKLQKLKHKCQSSSKPLQQAVKRLDEGETLQRAVFRDP
jgi:hypothetical protein